MEDLARLRGGAAPPGCVLRPAAEADAPAVLALAREMCACDAGQGVPADDDEGLAWAVRWIRGHLAPGRFLHVAEVEGRVAGFASASAGPAPALSHVAQLSLVVGAHCRRQGLGRALLDAVLRWAARSPGVDKLQLAVLAGNAAAIALYRRCGFRQEGRLRGQVQLAGGTRTDQLLMARAVAHAPDPACHRPARRTPTG